MSSNPKVGQLITGDAHRDAIHMAIAPVVAAQSLVPGQHVGFIGLRVGEVGAGQQIGIVDPFLPNDDIRAGDRFWLYLYPGSIVSLRHEWEHPAFTEEMALATTSAEAQQLATMVGAHPFGEAQKSIEGFAKDAGLTVEELMAGAADFLACDGEYIRDSRFEGVFGDEFWNAYEKVASKKVPADCHSS